MSETTRIRRSAEQWQQLIDEHAESGLSQSAFCKREHLSLSSFTNWKRKRSTAPGHRKASAPGPTPWIDLGNLGVERAGWDIELDLGDGICLRLRRG